MEAGLIDDFIRDILSVPFCPYHFFHSILSIAFCPYHFVRYHFVLEPLKLVEEERSLLTIIRTRQQKWMGHIMRGDSLQREIIEGRMEDKRGRGRPRQKLLDWMMSEGYSKHKEGAQHRETWSYWRFGPARGQRT